MSEFDVAKAELTKLVKRGGPSDTELLQAYKFFKQGSGEDFSQATKPWPYDLKGKAKYNAWQDVQDVPVEEAKNSYIELVAQLKEKYPE